MGVADSPKNKLPPTMCYHFKFGSSAIKGVRINRKEPQKGKLWDPIAWGGGVADP